MATFTATAIRVAFVCASPICAMHVYAQGTPYPAKPIRLIVPQTASGQVDTVARTLAQHLGERLGQPLIVENRAGANGIIGTDAVAKAAPDGHTLLFSAQSAVVFNAVLKKTLPYDPITDFSSISMVFETPYYFVVHPSVPAKTLQELLALARAQPGKLNYGTVGTGSGQHLYMEVFKGITKTDIVHVPYKGSAQAGTDLLTGQVQMMLQGPGFTIPQAKAGKTRVLATTGSLRLQGIADIPTVIEAGVPGYVASTWYALAAPARLPRVIVDRLNRETGEILRLPAVQEKFAVMDLLLVPGTPEALTERVRREIPMFAKVVREAGIDPE
ncbi:MAG: Bug family tripartite tricarboxylate transporter substrate binding protein [Burkholderiales bacterium]